MYILHSTQLTSQTATDEIQNRRSSSKHDHNVSILSLFNLFLNGFSRKTKHIRKKRKWEVRNLASSKKWGKAMPKKKKSWQMNFNLRMWDRHNLCRPSSVVFHFQYIMTMGSGWCRALKGNWEGRKYECNRWDFKIQRQLFIKTDKQQDICLPAGVSMFLSSSLSCGGARSSFSSSQHASLGL